MHGPCCCSLALPYNMGMQSWIAADDQGLSEETILRAVRASAEACGSGRVLLVPPDQSRFHSGCGHLTNLLFHLLESNGQRVDIMPALGTHEAMTDGQIDAFFGPDIPKDRFLRHHWRQDTLVLGHIPEAAVSDISEGLMRDSIAVEINRALLGYDCILSLGQVVPHEVIGMSGYTKNLAVGVGGRDMIGKSHLLGALYGMERALGRIDTPVRGLLDYAQAHFLDTLPVWHLLTVATTRENSARLHGLFLGGDRRVFEEAAALAQRKNITFLDRPIQKAVVFLDPFEYHSLWIGNKAIYRTRMALADGGELVILAKGVAKFGEDPDNDRLLRRFGYPGKAAVTHLMSENSELRENQAAASVMIYGSTEGRFRVTYCADESLREDLLRAGYGVGDYTAEEERYRHCTPGWSHMPDGEEIYYVENPTIGLWALPFQQEKPSN